MTLRENSPRAARLTLFALCAFAVPLAPTVAQDDATALRRELERHRAAIHELETRIAEQRREHAAALAEAPHESDELAPKRVAKSLKVAVEALQQLGKHEDAKVVAQVLTRVAHDAHGREVEQQQRAAELEREHARLAEHAAALEAKRAELARIEVEQVQRVVQEAKRAKAARAGAEADARRPKERADDDLEERLAEMQRDHERQVQRLERKVDELADMVQKLAERAQPPRKDGDAR